MSKLEIVRRCAICGAVLQTSDKKKEGYVDEEILEETPLDGVILCQNCFHENRFNRAPKEAPVTKDFLTMLRDAQASDALIVYIVDLFSFECSFQKPVIDLVKRLPLLVIGNKRDLLPDNTDDDALKEYVAHRFRVAGVQIKSDDVVLSSLSSLSDLTPIVNLIEEKRKRHDVYIIGAPGSGKSLFFNGFLRTFDNKTSYQITTDYYPGTSLRLIKIPLDSSSALYDTPGTGLDNYLASKLDAVSLRNVTPSEAIRPLDISMESGTSLLIGGVARLDLLKGSPKIIVKAYFAPGVGIKKISSKLDPDEEFKKVLSNKNMAPSSSLLNSLKDFDVFQVKEEIGNRDLGIAGLGWISYKGDQSSWRIYVPRDVGVYASRAKITLKIKKD